MAISEIRIITTGVSAVITAWIPIDVVKAINDSTERVTIRVGSETVREITLLHGDVVRKVSEVSFKRSYIMCVSVGDGPKPPTTKKPKNPKNPKNPTTTKNLKGGDSDVR